MKTQQPATIAAFALFLIAVIFSCQKEPVTKPVAFTETEYQVLVPYDSTTGIPKNMEKDVISAEMLNFVKNNLPEQQDMRKTNPELLNTNTSADVQITQKSDVYLTFVHQVTRFRNAIAFYTYKTGNPPASPKDIKTIHYVFPSAGVGTALKPGDKLRLGNFEAGTTIGLVMIKDAWDPATGKLNNGGVHFCYNDVLNPEVDPKLKKHVVLLNYPPEHKTLIGFEDIDRTSKECDHDFNDVVLYISTK